jgi:hypothetical protein
MPDEQRKLVDTARTRGDTRQVGGGHPRRKADGKQLLVIVILEAKPDFDALTAT